MLFFGPNGFEPKRERLAARPPPRRSVRRLPGAAWPAASTRCARELYGVWGGLGEADRRALLEQRGGIAHRRSDLARRDDACRAPRRERRRRVARRLALGYEPGPDPDRPARSPVTRWEYATAPLISHALQQILNQWGDDGWELVASPRTSPTSSVPRRQLSRGDPSTRARRARADPARPPTPAAAYQPWSVAGELVFTAGQLPLVDGAARRTGRSARLTTEEGAARPARRRSTCWPSPARRPAGRRPRCGSGWSSSPCSWRPPRVHRAAPGRQRRLAAAR
jgi:hypothetical protein